MQNKVVFYRDNLRKLNLPANLPSLGLLQAVEGLTLQSKSLSHNFLHLSVQELLAAYHISHIDSSKQLEVFERVFGSTRLQAVLQYYSGFTKLGNPEIRDFISTYARQKSSIEDLLPLLHCFYEVQEPPLCKLVFTQKCIIELNSALKPVDYLAIGYFVTSLLSVPSSNTSNILLTIRIVDKYSLKLLLLELSKYPIGEASERRLEITVQDENINSYSHQLLEGLQHNTSLVRLNLSNTGLVATEDTAQALTTILQVNKTLAHLNLSNNEKFSDSGAYCVFQGLQHNTSLVHLNLSTTEFVATENTVQALTTMLQVNKTLKHLNLSSNKFSPRCVFQGLLDNTSLVHLKLSNVDLEGKEDTVQALTTMLQVNKRLTHLNLSNNENFSDSGAYCVFQDLQRNTSLVHLNLSTTELVATENTAQALTAMLQVNKTLTHLNLSNNENFSDSGAYCVFQGLQHNTSLVHLNLSTTKLVATENTVQALTTMLQVNKTLKHLNLSSNKFSPRCVFQGLQDNTSLVHLNLSNVDLEGKEETVQALTTMLQVNKTLTHLDLSWNWNFTDSEAYFVFQSLQHNTSLVHLDLSTTKLVATENTVQALTTMLQVNKTLKHLNLSSNKFSPHCVFQGLQDNTSLVHLNLSNIDLKCKEDTAQALTTMLQVNKTLTHLDLSWNWKFIDSGAYCVFQGLQHNNSLVYLNLSDTEITDKGAEYIAQALKLNHSLKTLDISHNKISDRGLAYIDKSSQTNTALSVKKGRQLKDTANTNLCDHAWYYT